MANPLSHLLNPSDEALADTKLETAAMSHLRRRRVAGVSHQCGVKIPKIEHSPPLILEQTHQSPNHPGMVYLKKIYMNILTVYKYVHQTLPSHVQIQDDKDSTLID